MKDEIDRMVSSTVAGVSDRLVITVAVLAELSIAAEDCTFTISATWIPASIARVNLTINITSVSFVPLFIFILFILVYLAFRRVGIKRLELLRCNHQRILSP